MVSDSEFLSCLHVGISTRSPHRILNLCVRSSTCVSLVMAPACGDVLPAAQQNIIKSKQMGLARVAPWSVLLNLAKGPVSVFIALWFYPIHRADSSTSLFEGSPQVFWERSRDSGTGPDAMDIICPQIRIGNEISNWKMTMKKVSDYSQLDKLNSNNWKIRDMVGKRELKGKGRI